MTETPGREPVTVDPSNTSSIDGVLSTTRAVRLRLDLERDVHDQVILDCIDIAEQAPTGGNLGSRRWIVVRDPQIKQRLAEIYRGVVAPMLGPSGLPISGVRKSAQHLAEHLAEVPVIVIPAIWGRHDGGGRPGLFDSVIQSAWSFCLALRARGLGTVWATAGLAPEADIKELLGIPAEVTEIVMFPVAHTIGLDFRPAKRRPAREITYFDGWGRIYEHGPSSPIGMGDCPGLVVEADISAPAAEVWQQVVDINMAAEHSEEFLGAHWKSPHTGPGLGAVFVGRNQHPAIGEWEVDCTVDVFDDGVAFGWCTNDPQNPASRWRFELERFGRTTRLRFKALFGPGPSGLTMAIENRPDLESRIIDRRMQEHRANMTKVIQGVKAACEAAG